MKFKALVIALAVGFSGSAFAESTTFNNLAFGSVTDFGGFLRRSGETDSFTFNLTSPASAAVSVFNLSFGPVNDISNFRAYFQGNALSLTSTPLGGFYTPIVVSSFNAPGALSSSFSLLVSGNGPAIYSGSFAVSNVPEPSSIAMMLAGLGVVGLIAIRRRIKR